MTTKEKNLKKGAKAFDLLQQIKKYANACFEQGTPEYEAVIHSVSILEKNFEPYSIQFKKIRDEKQQKELVAKETCTREGHTGEWHEHEYTVWAICGDRGFFLYINRKTQIDFYIYPCVFNFIQHLIVFQLVYLHQFLLQLSFHLRLQP